MSGDSGDDAADPPAWKSNIGRHAIDAEKFPHSDPLLVLGIANTQGPRAALFRELRPLLDLLAGVRRPVVVLLESARYGVVRGLDLVLSHLTCENGIDDAIVDPSLVRTGV